MHGDPGVFRQPGLHVGVLVGGVVVADDMQFHVRVVVGDEAEEVNEFLVCTGPEPLSVLFIPFRELTPGCHTRSAVAGW